MIFIRWNAHLMYSSLYTDSRYVDMAKSSLLMRAEASGEGSSRLMMVERRSLSSAFRTQHVHTGYVFNLDYLAGLSKDVRV